MVEPCQDVDQMEREVNAMHNFLENLFGEVYLNYTAGLNLEDEEPLENRDEEESPEPPKPKIKRKCWTHDVVEDNNGEEMSSFGSRPKRKSATAVKSYLEPSLKKSSCVYDVKVDISREKLKENKRNKYYKIVPFAENQIKCQLCGKILKGKEFCSNIERHFYKMHSLSGEKLRKEKFIDDDDDDGQPKTRKLRTRKPRKHKNDDEEKEFSNSDETSEESYHGSSNDSDSDNSE